MDKEFQDIDDKLKKQDDQIELFHKAMKIADEGNIDKAIAMLEKIMYEDGLVVQGVSWPFILSDIYYKNKMYNQCWKYLNFIYGKFPYINDKIREMQSKILIKENKFIDALVMRMSSMLMKYTIIEFKPSIETVNKTLIPIIKKAELENKKDEIINLYQKYIKINTFDECQFREEFKTILK